MSTAPIDSPHTALSCAGVSKRFGGTQALESVDADFARGSVTAVIGANGSGKSTLLRILSGNLPASQGAVIGPAHEPIEGLRQAQSQGAVLVPQDPTLAEHLSVWENITLGRPEARRGIFTADREARRFAETMLEGLLPVYVAGKVTSSLNKSSRQLVQLAAAMARRPKVLLLDEPTAVLDEDGVVALHALIRRFVGDGGTVLIVSHRVRDILELASKAVVLRNGKVEYAGEVSSDSEAMIVRMLSEQEGETLARERPEIGAVALHAEGLRGVRGLSVDSFTLRAGEIVGVAGQSGSGRSRLAAILAGAVGGEGNVSVGGKPLRLGDVCSARSLGVHYVPEDRLGNALLANQSVAANLAVGRGSSHASKGGFRRRGAEAADARALIDRFDIRPPEPERQAGLLSGGNQQKVVMARALADGPKVLIADEPTQGVDVGARSSIHRAVVEAAEAGTAALVVCSEFEELFDLCHRLVVVRDGQVVLDAGIEDVTPEEVLAVSLGADTEDAEHPPTTVPNGAPTITTEEH